MTDHRAADMVEVHGEASVGSVASIGSRGFVRRLRLLTRGLCTKCHSEAAGGSRRIWWGVVHRKADPQLYFQGGRVGKKALVSTECNQSHIGLKLLPLTDDDPG